MGHISVSALLPWFLHLTTHAALKVKSYINTYVPENPKPHHQIPIVYFPALQKKKHHKSHPKLKSWRPPSQHILDFFLIISLSY